MANGILGMPPGVLNQQQGTQLMGAGNDLARQRAISGGALRAGAGMLMAPNLQEGLGQGLLGFSEGYNRELIANRPKVTPLANGAFSQISFPDGRVEVMSNDKVQEFLRSQEALKLAGKQTLAEQAAGLAIDRKEKEIELKRKAELAPVITDTETLLNKYADAEKIVQEQSKSDIGLGISGAQVQGIFPGIAGFFGGDEVAKNKFLQGLVVDETLLNTARTAGAISNAEMNLFKSPMPSLTDSRKEVWEPFIKQRRALLKTLLYRMQNDIKVPWDSKADAAQVDMGTSPQATPLPPTSGVPTFNSPDEVKAALASGAIQPGTQFKAPNGKLYIAK